MPVTPRFWRGFRIELGLSLLLWAPIIAFIVELVRVLS